MFDKWVVDATMGAPGGLLCFCPVECDEDGDISSVITGMNLIADMPTEGDVIAVIHADGNEAVERFCDEHSDIMDRLAEAIKARRAQAQP